MRKYIPVFLVFLLITELSAETPKPCKAEEKTLVNNHIDLDTRTLKGWIRLLKNRSKMNDYGVTLTQEEVSELIKCLKVELDNRKKMGKLV